MPCSPILMGMAIPQVRIKLAKRLRQLRIKAGLTQEEAAERVGLDIRNYQRLESLKPRAVRIDTLDRLAKGFDVPLWKLLKF